MFQKQTTTLARPVTETQPAATVAPHPMPSRASQEKKHEPSEAVRSSVDRLIDQANRFAQRNDQETPERLRATFQFD